MKSLFYLAVVLLSAAFVCAQTVTVVNGAGATVVELLTDNAAGVLQTQILSTVAAAAATTATISQTNTKTSTSNALTAPTTTTTTGQQGPVGQPPTTQAVPGGETPYIYTTTDANGNTFVTSGIFTPTGPATVLPSPTTTGTVLGYSQWLSIVGTYTVAPNAAHRISMPMATGWYYFAATTLVGLAGGVWLLIIL